MDLLMELLDAPQQAQDTTAEPANTSAAATAEDTRPALRFITCGSVDDGKSTLIGRLLLDSRSVLQDQLASVSRSGAVDLAQFTDGLSAEREQGITIDVAYRYFSTARRKFIIGDAPGHEQYTRNMVTAASSADAAVVLVDATKLPWHGDTAPSREHHQLLPQTRRHSLLARMLRVPSIVFAVNKLDAVADAPLAFANIRQALESFARAADIPLAGIVPISALHGNNVAHADALWCGYRGPGLLELLEQLPATSTETTVAPAFPVQWVEKLADDNTAASAGNGHRVFWGRVATGRLAAGQRVAVMPGGQVATVTRVLDHARRPVDQMSAGRSAGLVLDRQVDVSRGDWLLAHDDRSEPFASRREVVATVAWLDDEPLQVGRTYWAVHGHRWVKARVTRIGHQLDVHTLERHGAEQLGTNTIGEVELALQAPIAVLPYGVSRALGALVLVDVASHKTAGAALLH
ncbi:GTP-binding protein [Comamonadaceae bacterium G21597-S1]|nr:GTP-binding protein [Comamonadaceae bacterium G21597-S1]